ncbi:MAG: penicillin-binding protein 1B [Gammaproteobacteria bacterium]
MTDRRKKTPTHKARKKPARKPRQAANKSRSRAGAGRLWLKRALGWTLLIAVLAAGGYAYWLDREVRERFEGKRWALPAQVYARPLELYAGLRLSADDVETELQALGYQSVKSPRRAGSYHRSGARIQLVSRAFRFWDGEESSRSLDLRFAKAGLDQLLDASGADAGIARLDPLRIGGIYPAQREDRELVRLEDVPERMLQALVEVEDRRFYDHFGLSPIGIVRAMWANLRAGGVVQGGSTLTQQLVKNFYLTNQRTLARKVNEAIMALSLEWHYDKDEILEAYLNEVYLGQAGRRAIHGFGLGSWFYFNRPLSELGLEQMALLVGLVKGPSYYNPRRHPERALERRNLVLDVLADRGVITGQVAESAKRRPLGVTEKATQARSRYPAFLDLVRRQLRRDYREEDLTTEGLRLFTTLDPIVQDHVERSVAGRVRYLERQKPENDGLLQAAALVTTVETGQVLAMVAGRDPVFAGFNRVLDGSRQVGSLIKPFVYLTALSQPDRFTLATLLDDSPLSMPTPGQTEPWRPANSDGRFHGDVLLREALVHSYNVATARLGTELGLSNVIDMLHDVGAKREFKAFPSLVLGAQSQTPFEVAQMYQTLAASGFRVPLSGIREVLTGDGTPVKRYGLEMNQAVKPPAVRVLRHALRGVVSEGTARFLTRMLPKGPQVAGKTGTTDDLRDSWFAGFTADYNAVVWVGRDDAKPAGFAGSSGAMLIFGDIFRRIGGRDVDAGPTDGVVTAWVSPETGLLADEQCRGAIQLPFIRGSAPARTDACVGKRFNSSPRENDSSSGWKPFDVLNLDYD